MKKLILTVSSLIALTGCLSVVRVPFPKSEKYSDDGVCTNRVWHVPMNEIMGSTNFSWRVYPTVYMRCVVTKQVFSPIDYTKKGEDLWKEKHKYWAAIPLAVIWATSPLDALVDTVYLPFDLGRTAGKE